MGQNRMLSKGVNNLYLTISELNTINNPIYNMIIKDETTHEEKSITLLDLSTNPIRFNWFSMSVVDNYLDEDLNNGIVYLNEGKHTYNFTTTNPISPYNSMSCEVGIVKVLHIATASTGISYTDNVADPEYYSYTGNINKII